MNEYYKKFEKFDKGNCSTVVIGKDASVTGKVILGHNEDDSDSIVELHLVPRMKHREGETISFKDADAVIPQVPETYSYYWSEVRCKGGISFADGFVNENGVAVVSNSCRPAKTPVIDVELGVGYAIRRLIAERAVSARDGVRVAAELVEKYGYFSGRAYTIADKDEAFVFQIPTGHVYAARKVGDDEVFYIPNWYTIHKIDFSDKEHKKFYFSENVVEYAIENGWYTPAKEGDYSDFDFAVAYQEPGDSDSHNIERRRNAWRILAGLNLQDSELREFSRKAEKKYSAEDVKAVLRSHYEGGPDDLSNGYERNPHRGSTIATICNGWTAESLVIEFNEDKYLTRMLRSTLMPCTSPYRPWYPVALTRMPEGYSQNEPLTAQISHFDVDDKELEYNPKLAWWTFKNLVYATEYDYKTAHEVLSKSCKYLESQWDIQSKGIEAAYNALKDTDIDAAREILTSYTCAQAKFTEEWAGKKVVELANIRILKNKKDWE